MKKIIKLNFKEVFIMFRILNALNKACYEYSYRHTLPFTEERDYIIARYVKRNEFLHRLKENYMKHFKRG